MNQSAARQAHAAAQFGVGCLHLVPREASGHEAKVSAWLSELSDVLVGLAGISDVETWFNATEDGADPALATLVPWFSEERSADSGSNELGVQFHLTVDRTLLDMLGPLYRGYARFPREIDVRITYIRDTPVVLAWIREDHGEATGTTVLDIARRHLALQLEGTGVALDVLEPTPFPADFRVFERVEGADADQLVSVNVETRPGFDLVDMEVDGHGAFEAIFDHVLYQVALEADDYYSVELAVDRAELRWDAIMEKFNGFIASQRGRRTPFRGNGSVEIRDLMLGLIETKAAILAERHDLLEQVEKARASDVGVLSEYIVERFGRFPDFPFDEYTRMLEFLEGRRAHRSDAVIALVSALIGGLVGSLYVLFGGY
jgi:hypothetical protein